MKEVGTGAEQADFMLRAPAPDPVSIAKIEARLTIHTEIRNFLIASQKNFNYG